MTLGLPEHLARESLGRALHRGGYAAALVCLLGGMAIALASVIDGRAWGVPDPRSSALIVLGLIALQAVAQTVLIWWPTVTTTVLTLAVGAGVAYGLTLIVMAPGNDFASTNNALLALPRVALVLLGGAGLGSGIAITWAALALGLGEAATLLASASLASAAAEAQSATADAADAVTLGDIWSPNTIAATAFGILVVIRVFDAISRRGDTRRTAGLYRASRQTRELAIRHDYEVRAIARLHDTALSHLVAIATAGSGPVPDRLRSGIRRDLALIVGHDWAIDRVEGTAAGSRFAAVPGPGDDANPTATDATGRTAAANPVAPAASFTDAVDLAAHAGVTVHCSGDAAALDDLPAHRREALDAAVTQCVANVVRHAGVPEAEVVVGATGDEVTVAVIDGGRGFDPESVPEDRIGLRTSIRARVEHAGGSVTVWSRPGVGTTVMLTMPTGVEA